MLKSIIVVISIFCFYAYLYANDDITNDYKNKLISSELYKTERWLSLLHFDNGKSDIRNVSDFFISPKGAIDAQKEFVATVDALFNVSDNEECSIICKYPARVGVLLEYCGIDKSFFTHHICKAYEEYDEKVSFDNVYVCFASENTFSPASMMGHAFLKVTGGGRSHVFNFSALLHASNLMSSYWNAFWGSAEGFYHLVPYRDIEKQYVKEEGRSIWEFKLKLLDKEKENLKKHLWELKEKNVYYSFTSHNCNTALINILRTANPEYYIASVKGFVTPIEYVRNLVERGLVVDISVVPSESNKKYIGKYGLKFVCDTPKPFRLSLGYDTKNDNAQFVINPVYKDFFDISNAYYSEMESKLLELSLRYSFREGKVIFDRINIMKIKSVNDFLVKGDMCKTFRFGFDNDLFSNHNELKPTIELGAGLSLGTKHVSLYVIPRIGYHYDDFSNFYCCPEIGLIVTLGKRLKVFNIYEYYFDSKADNRGYESSFSSTLSYGVSENLGLQIGYSKYYEADTKESMMFGLSYHF